MALGFNTEARSGGDILPIVKFDAKSGDFIARNRVQGGDGMWENVEEELQVPFKAIFDFDNIQVGWLSFSSGAPDFQMVTYGERLPRSRRLITSRPSGSGSTVRVLACVSSATAQKHCCGRSTLSTTNS